MRLITPIAALAILCAIPPAFATTYEIADLGKASTAIGINSSDHVSGTYLHSHAAVYADGNWKRYTDKSSHTGELDQSDDMVGQDKVGPQLFVPMYFDHTKSTRTPIPLPNNGKNAGPWDPPGGISADGKHVVGPYIAGSYIHCFQWTPGSALATDFGPPADYQWCEANAVNKSGVVAGEVEDSDGKHAYLYSNGQFDIVGGVDTVFYAINGHGHAVGTTGSPFTAAMYWNGSTLVTLPTQGPLSMTLALALNATDTIVGQGKDGNDYTCILYSQGTLVDLMKSISNPGNWTLNDCDDINDAGVIVGNGFIGGEAHAFMLRPQ